MVTLRGFINAHGAYQGLQCGLPTAIILSTLFIPSPFMPFFTDFAGQKRIDQQILEHEAAIYQLKLQRNALSGAHNLPGDVLSIVATIYKELSLHTHRGSWLNILAVCARWRGIIPNLPQFWATISSKDSRFIDTMLRRSHQMPLRLHYRLDHRLTTFSIWNMFWEAVAAVTSTQQTHEIETMSVTYAVVYPPFSAKLRSVLQSSPTTARSIRSLRLVGEVTTPDDYFSTTLPAIPPTYHLESQILLESMTSLRSLELVDVLVPSDIPPLPSLSTLNVSCSAEYWHGLSLQWVLSVLRHTPNVEFVTLGVLGFSHRPEVDELHISLPKLRTFNVETDELQSFKLFDHLDLGLHGHTHTTVTLVPNHTETHNAPSPFALTPTCFSQTMSGFRSIPLEKVAIYRDDLFSEFHLSLFSPGHSAPFLNLDLPSQCFDLHHYTGWFSSRCLSLGSVTELSIDDATIRVASKVSLSWIDFFKLFANLKVLNLASVQSNDLTVILRSLLCLDGTSYVPRPTMPNVEVMSFSRIDWTYVTISPLSFRGSLQRREAPRPSTYHAHGLDQHLKFIITRCTIKEEKVEMLRKHVSVDWDGVSEEETRPWWAIGENGSMFSDV
ncbi:hypothetical protein ONZ45_g18642 [Pleurotus djamor]|nr:hypothetical protein ONZ45_g18642 [Pleurotus djamor]